MPNWTQFLSDFDHSAPAPATPAKSGQSAWRRFVDALTNRDWGRTADYVSSSAEHGIADIAGMAEGMLNNPLVTRQMPASLSDLTSALSFEKTPLTNKAREYIPQAEPQDKGDIYAGRGVEAGVAGLPFGGPGVVAGVGSGIGGQAGRDLTDSDIGDLAGQLIGGAIPFAPHAISSIRAGRGIRAGAANPDFERAVQITMGTESNFNPHAVSPKGARGLMQVMPDTARDPGHHIRPSDGSPADDVRVGKQLFASLLNKYDHDFGKAWAAYNWGEGRVDSAIKRHGEDWLAHAPHETQNYVLKNMSELVGSKYTGPAGPDGLGTNGSVPPMDSRNIANVMQDREMLDALDKKGQEPDWTDPTLFNEDFANNEDLQTNHEGPYLDEAEPENIINLGQERETRRYKSIVEEQQRQSQQLDDSIQMVSDDLDRLHNGEPSFSLEDIQKNKALAQEMLDRANPDTHPLYYKIKQLRDSFQKLEDAHSDPLTKVQPRDSSHEKFTPYIDKPNESANVNEPGEPLQKTLHDYTDREWAALSNEKKQSLLSEAEARRLKLVKNPLPSPEAVQIARARGFKDLEGPLAPTKDQWAEMESLASDNRDTNPPAQSGTFGTKPPEGINRKPPTKSPEGHDEGRPEDLRVLQQNRKRVVSKLGDAIEQTTPLRKEAADLLTKERARRMAKVYATRETTGGEAGFYKELSALKGSMGRPKIESIRHWFTQPEIDRMYDMINDSSLSGYDTINAKTALNKLLGADYGEIPTANDIKLLAKAIPLKESIWKQLLKNEEGSLHLPEGALKIADVANFSRTMRSSFDLSAPFRQGVFMIGSKAFWKNIPKMVKMFANKEFFEKEMRNMRLDPLYSQAKDDGLAITDTHGILQDREEAFMSRLAGGVPGVKMSERAYTGYLNKLRFDTYKNYASLAEKGNIPFGGKTSRDAARFINSASGRGDLGDLGNAAAPLLSGGFFSPRLIAARVNMLNPYFYYRLDPFVRVQAMKSLLSFTGIAAMSLGLLHAAGAKVDLDWRHPGPDFGKAVIGDIRIDVLGGFQQYIRFGLELATGMKKSQSGNVKELNAEKAGPYDPTYASEAGRFVRSKLAPVPAAIFNYADGKKDFLGRPMTVSSTLKDLFVPMAAQDIFDAYQDYGAGGAAAVAGPTILGVGVNTYQPTAKKGKSDFGFGKEFKDPFGKQFPSNFSKDFK